MLYGICNYRHWKNSVCWTSEPVMLESLFCPLGDLRNRRQCGSNSLWDISLLDMVGLTTHTHTHTHSHTHTHPSMPHCPIFCLLVITVALAFVCFLERSLIQILMWMVSCKSHLSLEHGLPRINGEKLFSAALHCVEPGKTLPLRSLKQAQPYHLFCILLKHLTQSSTHSRCSENAL